MRKSFSADFKARVALEAIKYRAIFFTALAFYLLISCENKSDQRESSTQDIQSDSYLCHPDTLEKWSRWAMRTDDGLWENDTDHSIHLEFVCTYGGEDVVEPPFYKINSMHLSGDTLFISDQAQEALICMSVDGSIFWEYGQDGEGPGEFTRIGPSDSASDWVAVCNTYGGRVELLNRSGELQSIISISNPFDVIALSDTSLAILSKSENGGNLHVYSLSDSLLYAFGRPSWTHSGTRSLPENTTSSLATTRTATILTDYCQIAVLFSANP